MKTNSYRCCECGHSWKQKISLYGCPPEQYRRVDCGAGDPAKCAHQYDEDVFCFGCSPCGRSKRRWRCAMCAPPVACPSCKHVYVELLSGTKNKNADKAKRRKRKKR